MLELIQIQKTTDGYQLVELYVNPKHVVRLSEQHEYSKLLREGRINLDLNKMTTFTNLVINEGDRSSNFIVVGDPKVIKSKLNKSSHNRKILKG